MFRCWSYLCTYLVIGFVGDRGRDDRGKFLYFTAIVSGLTCTCNFANNLLCVICVCRRWWWWHDGNGRHNLRIWITRGYWWRWSSPTLWQHRCYKGMHKIKTVMNQENILLKDNWLQNNHMVCFFHGRLTRELVNQKFGSTKTKTLVGQKEKPQSLMMTVKQPRQLSTGSMVCNLNWHWYKEMNQYQFFIGEKKEQDV